MIGRRIASRLPARDERRSREACDATAAAVFVYRFTTPAVWPKRIFLPSSVMTEMLLMAAPFS